MLVITFHTTTEAMAMETTCKAEQAPGRLIPVPKSITAGCGMAWCAKPELELFFKEFMENNQIKPEGVHICVV